MPAPTPHPGPRRAAFILTLWADGSAGWRGCLETSSGERWYFTSLERLNSLIARASGWVESPDRLPGAPSE